jgi:hypothetical protein
MDNALALTGFYFTIIGFISGLFFTRLDTWYGQVKQFSGSVNLLQSIEEYKRARLEIGGIKTSAPTGSFFAIGIFTTVLLVLALLVPINATTVNPLIFIRIPLVFTVFAYWLGGGWLLVSAKKLLAKSNSQIEKAFKK